jgi:hypothetical protein
VLPGERNECRSVMERLGRVFDRPIGDDLLTDYWDALRDVPLPVLRERAARQMREAKFFPKPRDLRTNPDGERRVSDTRSPETGVDDWTAALNRVLLRVLMVVKPADDSRLRALVAEKNRIAAQMREAQPTREEWREMVPGIVDSLSRMANN